MIILQVNTIMAGTRLLVGSYLVNQMAVDLLLLQLYSVDEDEDNSTFCFSILGSHCHRDGDRFKVYDARSTVLAPVN
jgi:hypothetical protein